MLLGLRKQNSVATEFIFYFLRFGQHQRTFYERQPRHGNGFGDAPARPYQGGGWGGGGGEGGGACLQVCYPIDTEMALGMHQPAHTKEAGEAVKGEVHVFRCVYP